MSLRNVRKRGDEQAGDHPTHDPAAIGPVDPTKSRTAVLRTGTSGLAGHHLVGPRVLVERKDELELMRERASPRLPVLQKGASAVVTSSEVGATGCAQ